MHVALLITALTATPALLPLHQPPPPLAGLLRPQEQPVPVTAARRGAATTMSALLGFGLGHLVVRDGSGALLFALVDVASVGVAALLRLAFSWTPSLIVGGVLLAASHVVQALDVYGALSVAPAAPQ